MSPIGFVVHRPAWEHRVNSYSRFSNFTCGLWTTTRLHVVSQETERNWLRQSGVSWWPSRCCTQAVFEFSTQCFCFVLLAFIVSS